VLNNFIPVVLYSSILQTFALPFAYRLVAVAVSKRYLPNLIKLMIVPTLITLPPELCDPEPFITCFCGLMVHIGELLTFGAASPPTAAALCVLIFVEAQVDRMVFGR